MKAAQIWLLTGERGAGKTSLCRALASQARKNGVGCRRGDLPRSV